MREGHMRHLSRSRFTPTILANFNHREVNVIVIINVFYPHSQTGRIAANISSIKLKITHHLAPPISGLAKTDCRKTLNGKAGTPYRLGFQRVEISMED
jgi:hypothetical protein